MRNTFKNGWTLMLTFAICLALFLPSSMTFATNSVIVANCPTPVSTLVSKSTGAVSFAWTDISGAVSYKVRYVRNGVDASGDFYSSSPSISFTGLPAGNYDFYFATVCDGTTSEYYIVDDIIIE